MNPGFLRLSVIGVVLVATCLLFAGDESPVHIKSLYKKAEALYNDPNITDEKDSAALASYYKLIALLEPSHSYDSILWDCYFKAATYEQTLGNYNKAIPLLLKNIALKEKLSNLPGALFFLPNLYTANSYYVLNRFDSARHFYSQAEQIAQNFPIKEGLERLYNGFGILNFETGNYAQSRNNFEKAISITESGPSPSPALLVNFRSNLASALRKLREYDRALEIYKQLLLYNMNVDELHQNIAASYLGKDNYDSSLLYLRKVGNPTKNTYNSLGYVFTKLQQFDSADLYLQKALALNNVGNPQSKSFDNGITEFYRGELSFARQDWKNALSSYQRAISQFIYSFDDTNVYKNPSDYYGCFAVSELFETLLSKSITLEKLYRESGNIDHLKASLETMRSLYRLTDYAEKTYESDEARIFLNQKKYESHHIPINICLELFRKTGDENYLKEAFFFDERNKASVLSIGINEKQLKKIGKIPEALLIQETNCKEVINSLTLKASSTNNISALEDIQKKLRDQQIVLESIDKKMNGYPSYVRLKFADNTIGIDELRNQVIPSDGVLVSYHWGDSSLLTWIISRKNFEHIETKVDDSLKVAINSLYKSLTSIEAYSDRANRAAIALIYSKLVKPIEDKIDGFRQLMIIPDDEINFVPFDILLNDQDERALEKFRIAYNYSCTLLRRSVMVDQETSQSAIGFAPYAGKELNTQSADLPLLPGSAAEIANIKGKVLVGRQASKDSFLTIASGYPIIHLATHAFANDANPIQSFIAFYPGTTDSISKNKLYSSEISGLNLGRTQLVILSACETGKGQLLKGEGIISLARSFYYAGCPNMITSQWKADDGSTAFISERIHRYLGGQKGIAEALFLAKKDYLEDISIDTRLKTPAYWAHLRFTGQFDYSDKNSLTWLWWLIPIVIGFTLFMMQKIRLASRTNRKGFS